MSVEISENLSLLNSLLVKTASNRTAQPAGYSHGRTFADRLEQALEPGETSTQQPQLKAAALAETLSLQMLHSSLSLGDGSAEQAAPLLASQSPRIQSMMNAYASQLAESGSATQPPVPSQLQEMTDTPPASTISTAPSTPNQAAPWLESIIARASNRYGVDAGLIKAVIKAESGFNPTAVSHAGAQGLMQLMPGTARSLGVTDSFDPEQNVMGGTRFLRDLLKRYNGNLDSALAAYNWGPGNVDKKPDHLPRETRDYLARVKNLYSSFVA